MTESLYKKFMYFWSICFLIAGLLFIVAPQLVIESINLIAIKSGSEYRLPQTLQFLWWVLAGSMMMTITYLSFEIARHPTNVQLVRALLICKAMSIFLFMVAALKYNFLYFVGAAVDFPIFLIILFSTISYRRRARV